MAILTPASQKEAMQAVRAARRLVLRLNGAFLTSGFFCINVRDPLYFLAYGIPYIYVNRILFSLWGNVG